MTFEFKRDIVRVSGIQEMFVIVPDVSDPQIVEYWESTVGLRVNHLNACIRIVTKLLINIKPYLNISLSTCLTRK
jgi:hypothetical protein